MSFSRREPILGHGCRLAGVGALRVTEPDRDRDLRGSARMKKGRQNLNLDVSESKNFHILQQTKSFLVFQTQQLQVKLQKLCILFSSRRIKLVRRPYSYRIVCLTLLSHPAMKRGGRTAHASFYSGEGALDLQLQSLGPKPCSLFHIQLNHDAGDVDASLIVFLSLLHQLPQICLSLDFAEYCKGHTTELLSVAVALTSNPLNQTTLTLFPFPSHLHLSFPNPHYCKHLTHVSKS